MTTATRRFPPWVIDTLLSLTLTIGAFVDFAELDLDTIRTLGWREPDPLAALLILVQTVPVAFRRRYPTTALVIASFGFFLDRNLNYPSTIAIFGLLFVFQAVGSELPRKRALITGWTAIGLMTIFTVSGVVAGQVSFGTPLVVFIFTSFPFLLGLESRVQRSTEAELAVRASQLEHDKTEAVQQERARIARELHDVVAHEMTVATIQATAARRLIGTDDEQAEKAAEEAERAGHEGLVELRRLLGVLRTDEPASRSPQPGLAQIDDLVDQMREAGIVVVTTIDGERRAIPPGMDLNAYRIVQESLTNVLKHAGPLVTTHERSSSPRGRRPGARSIRAARDPRSGAGIAGDWRGRRWPRGGRARQAASARRRAHGRPHARHGRYRGDPQAAGSRHGSGAASPDPHHVRPRRIHLRRHSSWSEWFPAEGCPPHRRPTPRRRAGVDGPPHPRFARPRARGDDLRDGLYVAFDPWRWHYFRLEPVVPAEAPTEEMAR